MTTTIAHTEHSITRAYQACLLHYMHKRRAWSVPFYIHIPPHEWPVMRPDLQELLDLDIIRVAGELEAVMLTSIGKLLVETMLPRRRKSINPLSNNCPYIDAFTKAIECKCW